jgi:hydrocephalus-inducing protein
MTIVWVRTTKPERSKAPKDKKDGKKDNDSKKGDGKTESVAGTEVAQEDEKAQFTFTVVPERMVLNPKMGYKVQFRANCLNVGQVTEQWVCQVAIGGDRKPKEPYSPKVTGEFITPNLSFSENKLDFKYLWEKGVASKPITRQLSLSNAGPLPTTVQLRIEQPFMCATERITLASTESETVSIDFDPGMKADRLSDKIAGKLTVVH